MELLEIAQLEELRNAQALRDMADEWRPLAGGAAGRGAPGLWINQAMGIGLSGTADQSELEDVVAWWEAHRIEPRLSICPYADPSLLAIASNLGFRLKLFDNLLFRELSPRTEALPVHPPPGVSIRIVDPADEAAVREAGHVSISGFHPEGAVVSDAQMDLFTRGSRQPRVVTMAAYLDGRCIGAGGCEITDTLCSLFALSVLPEFRRRGIQHAMIAARVNEGIRRGVRLATVGSGPRLATERNAIRLGFRVAYTRVSLVCPLPKPSAAD